MVYGMHPKAKILHFMWHSSHRLKVQNLEETLIEVSGRILHTLVSAFPGIWPSIAGLDAMIHISSWLLEEYYMSPELLLFRLYIFHYLR